MTEEQSMHPLFNTWMRAASLWTDRETMSFRSQAINHINDEGILFSNHEYQLELIKLVFCDNSENIEWFQHVFIELDDQFPQDPKHNKNELQVLAAIALALAIEDEGEESFLLANKILTASLQSNRMFPIPSVPLVDIATDAIGSGALKLRQSKSQEKLQITRSPWSDLEEEVNKLSGGMENGRAFLKALGSFSAGLKSDIMKLSARQNHQFATITNLQEEVDLLWWIFNGYSEICEQKFVSIAKPMLPVILGIEISQKISRVVEPPSLFALITRVLDKANQSVQLSDALSDMDHRLINYSQRSCPVITPISYAIKCIEEDPEHWSKKWEKMTGLSTGLQLNDRDLAIQCCREQLILQAVE